MQLTPFRAVGNESPHARRHSSLTIAMAGMLLCVSAIQVHAQPGDPEAIDAPEIEAVSRDLGLSVAQARNRIAAERAMVPVLDTLRPELTGTYAGAWIDDDEVTLVVATTDARHIGRIQAGGARAVVVDRNLRQLDEMQRRLDEAALQLSDAQRALVWTWGIDIPTNGVSITIPANDPAARLAAQDLLTLSGIEPETALISESTEGAPILFTDLGRGGDKYTNVTDSGSCSIGFSVNGGYVTAGHCSGGTTGDTVNGYNGASQGTFVGSQYPSHDRAWVSVNSGWLPLACVGTGTDRNCGAAPNVRILGSAEALINSTVCRYGATTNGPHCGVIQATGQSVNFGAGIVQNLVRTNACAEPGDSGGPFVFNNQGQGTVTGGSGNCTVGGTTYYYPLNASLTYFSLTLQTAPATVPPTPGSISTNPAWVTYGPYTVTWPAASGATYYTLQRETAGFGNWSTISTTTSASKYISSSPSGEYQHRVRACNSQGCSGWRTGAWILVCTSSSSC